MSYGGWGRVEFLTIQVTGESSAPLEGKPSRQFLAVVATTLDSTYSRLLLPGGVAFVAVGSKAVTSTPC
jgi:hypothetical protein